MNLFEPVSKHLTFSQLNCHLFNACKLSNRTAMLFLWNQLIAKLSAFREQVLSMYCKHYKTAFTSCDFTILPERVKKRGRKGLLSLHQ